MASLWFRTNRSTQHLLSRAERSIFRPTRGTRSGSNTAARLGPKVQLAFLGQAPVRPGQKSRGANCTPSKKFTTVELARRVDRLQPIERDVREVRQVRAEKRTYVGEIPRFYASPHERAWSGGVPKSRGEDWGLLPSGWGVQLPRLDRFVIQRTSGSGIFTENRDGTPVEPAWRYVHYLSFVPPTSAATDSARDPPWMQRRDR